MVNDGSTDKTSDVASRYGPPVRVIDKANGGPASARNRGAAEASGEWIALLDADDWWFPNKLEREFSFVSSPAVGLVHCLIASGGNAPPSFLSFADLWQGNCIINSSAIVRRTAFEALGGFDEARELISVEDYNLWLRIAASKWMIVTCPEVLVHYSRGIGISSDTDRFVAASLYNIESLARRLALPPKMVREKRAAILASFGKRALYERRTTLARSLLWKALRGSNALSVTPSLAASFLPRPILDVKRRTASRWESSKYRVDDTRTLPGRGRFSKPSPLEPPVDASIIDSRWHTPTCPRGVTDPLVIITVDAEESFDWGGPFTRSASDVSSMRHQHRAHAIFARYGAVPLYLVDYPVATQDTGRGPLREYLSAGLCEIGTQLHPWVTPPFVENVSVRNTFSGNLPEVLEREKLHVLTRVLEDSFGIPPRIYRAGRYGAGPMTAVFLKELSYLADTSVMPRWNFRSQGGPDYRAMTAEPVWIDAGQQLLELPISAALVGKSGVNWSIAPKLFEGPAKWSRLPGAMARLNLMERVKLTPEGITISEAKRLVHHMLNDNQKIFILTYHTPSLEPGNTPYVKNEKELESFLLWIDEFLDFFTIEIKGRCASWKEVYDLLRRAQA